MKTQKQKTQNRETWKEMPFEVNGKKVYQNPGTGGYVVEEHGHLMGPTTEEWEQIKEKKEV